MYVKNAQIENSVGLNSIVTFRYQAADGDCEETVYETFKIMADPEEESIYNIAGANSIIGKALQGGIKNQRIFIKGYGSAKIVEILNDTASQKVGKDSIVEIELYKEFDCKDLIETTLLACGDDNRNMLNNKEINSVVKIYYSGRKPEFAKIKRVISRREAQLTKAKNMNRCMANGEYLMAIQAISNIQQFIIEPKDITEGTIDIYEKMVICHLNNNSLDEAIKCLNYLLDFEINSSLRNRVKVMLSNLIKIKTNLEIVAIEEEKYSILVHLGNLYVRLGAYVKAIEIYDQAKEIDITCAEAFNGVGGALRQLERHPEAIEEFEEALVRGGNEYISYMGLGGISGDLGDFRKAIKFYKEAIKTGHEQQCGEEYLIEAYKGLIAVYIKTGESMKAQQYAEIWNSIAEKLMKTDLQKALNCISSLLNILSDYEKARETERRILALINCA